MKKINKKYKFSLLLSKPEMSLLEELRILYGEATKSKTIIKILKLENERWVKPSSTTTKKYNGRVFDLINSL